jgi:two-component system OmpR family sensor kinase
VLDTASTTSEGAGVKGWTVATSIGRRHLLAAWTVWAVGCVIAMFMRPGQETIPYHLGWAGFALAFGLGTWSRWQLVTALTWYTLATGVALERSWLVGNIGWDETTEIPLMFLLALLMVWHVRRRQAALAEVTRLAERDVQACLDREQLMRLTSHELRTPLTIARGYVELMQTRVTEPDSQQDLAVVGDELERLSRVSDRLIRMILLQDDTTNEMVDIDQVMAQAVERWQVVADRRWVLDAQAGRVVGSPERLRTGLDTLVENAIRYTSAGDTIRLVGSRRLGHVIVGVFDTGVGLTDHQIVAINADEKMPPLAATAAAVAGKESESATEDHLAGTGLGLSIVQALAQARGGKLHASHAPGGGAGMILTFPLHSPSAVGSFVPRVASDGMPMKPAVPPEWSAPTTLEVPGVAES